MRFFPALILAIFILFGCETDDIKEVISVNKPAAQNKPEKPKETLEKLTEEVLELHSQMALKAESPDLTGYDLKSSHAVKYSYYGGLMMTPGPEPLKKRFNYWKTFFYKNSQLHYTKEHPAGEGKQEFIADAIKYNDKGKPQARLIYRSNGGLEYGIYVLYKNDMVIMSARVYPGRKVKFISFHNNFKPEE